MIYDVLINGRALSDYNGAALLDYVVGETKLTPDTFTGINRTSWRLLKNRFGLRPITVTLLFRGPTLREAKLRRSQFNGCLFGKIELFLPGDGFFYSCYCTSQGDEELVGVGDKDAAVKATYTFQGVRHDQLVSVSVSAGGTLWCDSSMPFTDCRLTAVAPANAASFTLGGAVFSTVAKNDVLVFDGIEGVILKNGAAYGGSTAWTHFPALAPGENIITASGPVTVEYYPTYM